MLFRNIQLTKNKGYDNQKCENITKTLNSKNKFSFAILKDVKINFKIKSAQKINSTKSDCDKTIIRKIPIVQNNIKDNEAATVESPICRVKNNQTITGSVDSITGNTWHRINTEANCSNATDMRHSSCVRSVQCGKPRQGCYNACERGVTNGSLDQRLDIKQPCHKNSIILDNYDTCARYKISTISKSCTTLVDNTSSAVLIQPEKLTDCEFRSRNKRKSKKQGKKCETLSAKLSALKEKAKLSNGQTQATFFGASLTSALEELEKREKAAEDTLIEMMTSTMNKVYHSDVTNHIQYFGDSKSTEIEILDPILSSATKAENLGQDFDFYECVDRISDFYAPQQSEHIYYEAPNTNAYMQHARPDVYNSAKSWNEVADSCKFVT